MFGLTPVEIAVGIVIAVVLSFVNLPSAIRDLWKIRSVNPRDQLP